MTAIPLPSPLRGLVPPLATPLLDEESLDRAGTIRLVEHVLSGGVAGLFLLGTTGEGPSLPLALQQAFIRTVVEQVAGRVPLLVGITDASAGESIALAEFAAAAGVQAVVLAPPYYYRPDQADLIRHVEYVAARVSLPLLLYNMPTHTKVSFAPETVRWLMGVKSVVGIKDSSGDLDYFRQIVALKAERADWTVMMGPEELLAEAVALGADGGVCGGGNLFPRLYVALYEAAQSGNRAHAAALQADVLRVASALYHLGSPGGTVTQGIKCALRCLGICGDAMAPPFAPLDDDAREKIRGVLPSLACAWR